MSVDDKTATATLVRGFNKRVGRTKEIVLQSMGKVDRTEDGTFDFYVSNFSKQQANATKLQKSFIFNKSQTRPRMINTNSMSHITGSIGKRWESREK